MKTKLLLLIVLTTMLSAQPLTIPTAHAKSYIEQYANELLTKKSLNNAGLPQAVTTALDQKIRALTHRIQKEKSATIPQNKLTTDVEQCINDFIKEINQSVSAKDVEKVVNKCLNQYLAEAGLSIDTIPPKMNTEFRSKKNYVITTLKNTLTQTSEVTMAEVSVLIHTIFDAFIDRMRYVKIYEIGTTITEGIDVTADQKSSWVAIPDAVRKTLNRLKD